MKSRGVTSTVLESTQHGAWNAYGHWALSMGATPGAYHYVVSSVLQQDSMRKRLADLKDLQDNWDGYGASRISESSLKNAMAILEATVGNLSGLGAPEISPNPNGTVSLEWEQSDKNAYVEIGNTRATGYVRSAGAPATYLQGSAADLTVLLPAVLGMLAGSQYAVTSTITALNYRSSHDV